MPRQGISRWIALALLIGCLPVAARAENHVLDDNDQVVGSIQGWEQGMPVIVVPNGPRRVPLRVAKAHFETDFPAKFTTPDCTGTAYADAGALDSRLGEMQGAAYVMRNKRSLYRTKPNAAPEVLTQQSMMQFGNCVPIGGDVQLIRTTFIRDMFAANTPPFRVQ